MKRRTLSIAASWAQLSLTIMAGATTAVGILYGAICLIEGAMCCAGSERQE